MRKLTIELMQEWAAKHGGKCLSTVYINRITPLRWQCSRGHEWTTSPAKIRRGTWCKRCAPIKESVRDMVELAAQRGGRFLSETFDGVREKYEWECAQSHRWSARAIQIKRGTWCPTCSSSGIGEEICRAYFEQLFGDRFPRVRPTWLRNPETGRPLELDGYCESLGIAFEHNGRQHYYYKSLFSSGKRKEMRRRDSLKIKVCRKRRIALIVVPEVGYLTSLSELRSVIQEQCEEQSVTLPSGFGSRRVDLSQIGTVDKLESLREIASEKGGKLLSDTYLGHDVHLLWECHKGHKWRAMPQHIKNNDSWCPKCWSKVRGRRDDQGKRRKRRLVSTKDTSDEGSV